MKKAAGYIRVSKFDGEGVSPENQRHKIDLQSQILGIDLVDYFVDLDISGSNTDRPEFQRMMRDIKDYDYIIVYKLSRFTRSAADFHSSMQKLDKHQVILVSVSENFDTGTPVGRLIRNVLVEFAQFEREVIAEQIRDNMMANAKRGAWNGGNPPFGYRVDEKRLVPSEDADLVRWIFRRFADGAGANVVRNELYKRGIKSPTAKKYWHKNTIRELVRNQVYVGRVVYGAQISDGRHEGIVPEELFWAAQKNLEDRSNKPARTIGSSHLLSGLLRCPVCGRKLNVHYNGKNRVRRYMCPGRNDGVEACKGPIVDADGLEAALVTAIFELMEHPEIFLASKEVAVAQEKPDHIQDKKVITKRLDVLKRVMKDIFADYYESRIITRQQFEEMNKGYLEEEARLAGELDRIAKEEAITARKAMDVEFLVRAIGAAAENWAVASHTERRYVITNVVSRIEIKGDNLQVWLLDELSLEIVPVEVRRGAMLF